MVELFDRSRPSARAGGGSVRGVGRAHGTSTASASSGGGSSAAAGSAAFKGTDDRSLVNKSQAAVPGVGSYEPTEAARMRQPQVASAFQSKVSRFAATDQQKTAALTPSAYSGAYFHGSMASVAAKAARGPSSAFASTTIRTSYVPLPKGEAERILRQAELDEEEAIRAEEELQAAREADPEWQAAEAARLAEEAAEAEAIEAAARLAAERVAKKEQEEARARWMAARAAEEWAWRQAEEEAEAVEAAQGLAKCRVAGSLAEERRKKREAQKVGALWAWNEAEEEEGEAGEEEDDDGDGADGDAERWRQQEEREARIAARAAELVREREETMRAEAAERAEAAAAEAGARAAERVREVQESERAAARAEMEARLAAEAARDADGEALRIAEAAMTAAQRARALQEREQRAAEREAELAAWEAEQSRLLAAEERVVRRAYEEARAAERERLDAEEKVRREAERERQALAVQDWSWQEAMELAFDNNEKVLADAARRHERTTLGAVKSRQRLAEEKSLARSQLSRMQASGFGTQSSAAFASTTKRDSATEQAMKFVNPELRAKQRTHERMLQRSTKRAQRLNECATLVQAHARRHLGRLERRRRIRTAELHVAAPPVQALVRGWKVRARLRWCASVATTMQRHARGMLGRRGVRVLRERVPILQACARGMAVRAAYRVTLRAAVTLAAGLRGMAGRGAARALRRDPVKVARWEQLGAVREELDVIDERLRGLEVAREAEQDQLKLALRHEADKLGAAYADAPQVVVMLKQERLATKDAAEIGGAIERTRSLRALLGQVPFNRAADALRAVAAEVSWLQELVVEQSRRDDLYRPTSYRPKELFTSPSRGTPTRSRLSRDEQLDSFRGAADEGRRGGVGPRGPLAFEAEEEPLELTEAEKAAEKARRMAAKRASSNGGSGAASRLPGWNEPPPQPKKWMGKGPPPPGWNKVRAATQPPKGLSRGVGGRGATTPGRKPSPRPTPGKPGAAPLSGFRASSPAVARAKSPSSRGASPTARPPSARLPPSARAPPSDRPTPTGFGPSPASSSRIHSQRTASPSVSQRSSPSQRTSPLGSARSVGSARSSALGSTRSVASSVGARGRPMAKRTMTQLDFESQRAQRFARAEQARQAEQLEKAKRQAQRSKRVAGFIIDPESLERQKAQREREAYDKIRHERARQEAEHEAKEERARQEASARQSQAAKAGEVALERLRERKAEERRKAAAAAEMQQAMVMEEERAREEERQLRAEQRRLRLETSFFARPLAH